MALAFESMQTDVPRRLTHRSANAVAAEAPPRAPPSPADDIIADDAVRANETFIPVTRSALVDRLVRPQVWAAGMQVEARRFFRYLDYWRQQQHATRLMRLLQAYEPFNPDSDLFVTRDYSPQERAELQAAVVAGTRNLLKQANFVEVPREKVNEFISTAESTYGLDLKVDFQVFEELLLYYRGASVKKEYRRRISKFFRNTEFDIPIYRRVFVLFKIKALDQHITDISREMKISEQEAEKIARKARRHLPAQLQGQSTDNVYLKIFKNLPRSELEMAFPNTQIRFRLLDKLWLGFTSGGALGAGLFGAAGKLALAVSSPIAAAGAVGGIGMVAFRQVSNFMNQKQRYMRVMAQNLYFHAMADNLGALTTMSQRAAEEDFKEEILLYSVLAKERVHLNDLADVDAAIEAFLAQTFNLEIDFDLSDALERLIHDGIVTQQPDGYLDCLPPSEAAQHIDAHWDQILDRLPAFEADPGREIEEPAVEQAS